MRTSLDHALRDRGGINEVRRRSGGHPTHFGVALTFALPDGREGQYEFEIGARSGGGYEVEREACRLGVPLQPESFFRVERGEVVEASREALRQGLYSAADLLRLGQLAPDPSAVSQSEDVQLGLFSRR